MQQADLAGVDAGTSGIYYFDAFESRQQTYIGQISTATPTTVQAQTPTKNLRPTLCPDC